jgi:FtsP/CotA-like multicopper oxidase with cupredoxin domain
MPLQDPNTVWTFDGTLPPKLLQARYGEPTLMRSYNTLPIDEAADHPDVLDPTMISNGFGKHTISTHEHNGHSPGESDGFAGGFYFPGQFSDYRWPMQLAGFSNNNNAAGAINFDASDPRAAIPCEAGETISVLVDGILTPRTCDAATGTVMIPGDWRETMSTHWFHDHMLDYTAQNVYKGNATMMNYYSALDRGNEGFQCNYEDPANSPATSSNVNLCFPSGTALNWGNRDYDVNLVVADKATDQNGQLWYNTVNHNGFLGDVMTVNWLYKPYLDVRARRYRFRILDGSVSRIMAIGLVQEVNLPFGQAGAGELSGPAGSTVSYNRVPFHMIANDGNILEHAVAFDGTSDFGIGPTPADWKGQLPSQTIAERYDIIVDFAKHGIKAGDKLYFVNIMEHQDGKGTKSKVAMADILSGKYNPVQQNGRWIGGDPGVGKFMELRVKALPQGQVDKSMDPVAYEPGGKTMLPVPIDRVNKCTTGLDGKCLANGDLTTARHHTMDFVRSQAHGGLGTPWMIKVDGGTADPMDPHRISAIEHGDVEVWTIKGAGGWTHPVHIHFEEGILLTRGGKLPPPGSSTVRRTCTGSDRKTTATSSSSSSTGPGTSSATM